jgi:multidrug efflux pump subunit AcrA (membrane-fusion protein)
VITKIAPIIDPASRTFEVCAAVWNPSGLLKPGMYVNTEIVVEYERDILMVPDTAVVLRDDKQVIYKIDEGNVARRVGIETGKKSDGYTALAGEITVEDSIVILGNAFLEEGQVVEVVEKR